MNNEDKLLLTHQNNFSCKQGYETTYISASKEINNPGQMDEYKMKLTEVSTQDHTPYLLLTQ